LSNRIGYDAVSHAVLSDERPHTITYGSATAGTLVSALKVYVFVVLFHPVIGVPCPRTVPPNKIIRPFHHPSSPAV
jgi:hypothetical protein